MSTLTKSKLLNFIDQLNFDGEISYQKIAFDALQQLEFPTTKNEYWKYTRLGKITNTNFTIEKSPNTNKLDIEKYIISDNFVVIENGNFRNDISSFDLSQVNIRILKPKESVDFIDVPKIDVKNPFQTLNDAFFQTLIFIDVPSNTKWENPVQIIYIQSKNECINQTKTIVTANKSSEANFVQTFISLPEVKTSFTNQVTEITLEDNAKISLDKIQIEKTLHVTTENIFQAKNSTFKINTFSLSGDLVRNNLNIAVEGENCETYLNGLVITKEDNFIDNHTFVNHLVPNCMSDEKYKYILDEKSTGVFNGKVVVQKDAQKINAYQQNANILLSDVAKINSKPELEIYADDVKCSHGSTTGQLDENALFYLQSRGISKDKAKKLLVYAFAGELIESINNEKLKELLLKLLVEKHSWKID